MITSNENGFQRKLPDVGWKEMKNVFIVGNGAIFGGNEPIKRWIASNTEPQKPTFMDIPEHSGFDISLAWISILLRLMRVSSSNGKVMVRGQEFNAAAILDARSTLANEFARAEDLRLRSLPADIKSKLNDKQTLFISLNWDTV